MQMMLINNGKFKIVELYVHNLWLELYIVRIPFITHFHKDLLPLLFFQDQFWNVRKSAPR